MDKILRVGDPHVKPDNIEESGRLLQFVLDAAQEYKVKRIEFMGDLMHTHAVMRMEVVDFWSRWTKRLAQEFDVLALVGNHDQPGDVEREGSINALECLEHIDRVTIVSAPKTIGSTLYVPHMSEEKRFCAAVKPYLEIPDIKTIVCHQTFDGSMYQNGFYAKDGFNLSTVSKFESVICGHIHKMQKFANVFYLGTPRWDNLSDANEKKGIWLFEENKDPIFMSTASVCEPVVSIELFEGDIIPDTFPCKTFLTLKGSSAWISSVSKEVKGKVRIIPKPTDSKHRVDRQALVTMLAYAEAFGFEPGVTAEEVISYLRGSV